MVQAYKWLPHQDRGSWSDPKAVLEYFLSSNTVVVAGSKGRHRKYAIEDVRHAISDDELAAETRKAIDQLNRDMETNLESETENCDYDEDNAFDSDRTAALLDQEETIGDDYFDDLHSSMTHTPPSAPVSAPEPIQEPQPRTCGINTRSQATSYPLHSSLHSNQNGVASRD